MRWIWPTPQQRRRAPRWNRWRRRSTRRNPPLAGDEANLGYTKIYAPMDGVVVSQPVFKGQTVNSAQQAPTLMRVANLDVMTVNAQVAEADVPQLKPGMPVYFTTLGHAERRYQSRIRQILPTPGKKSTMWCCSLC